jgi:ABC-type sugar transport system ATPase subunit
VQVGEGVQAEASWSSEDHEPIPARAASDAREAASEASLGFVQQHDVLMPTLTVTETILLGMMLREHVKQKETTEAAATVASLLSELGLQSMLRSHSAPVPLLQACKRQCTCGSFSGILMHTAKSIH